MADLKDPGVYKPLGVGIMLMLFQQLTGINAIMFYAETIFEKAHFKVRIVQCYLYFGSWTDQCFICIYLL